MKRKICVITGTRAEYGLLKPVIDEIKNNQSLKLQLIATGMHLSPEFGLTYKEIEKDGIKIDEKIEILLSSDSAIGVSKAMGLALISFAEVFQKIKPDLIIGLGDRFELFAAISSALLFKILIAHIHGGELTAGAYDDAFRHSITKMSHLHFASTEEYRQRIIQLGENPKYVFNFGAPGLDNIKKLKLFSKKEFERSINFKIDFPTFLITFHPVTLEKLSSEKQFAELLSALNTFKNYKFIFSKPNADNDGRKISKMIDEFVEKNNQAIAFSSLGTVRYLSALKYVDAVIGNSSSGIIEAPSFKVPTVNIGSRQKGRIQCESIINCTPDYKSIVRAIKKACSSEFLRRIKNVKNPYGDGMAAKKIVNKISKLNLDEIIIKDFYDYK
jgi:UDP-hydrolysing UDP-N-acetyl-D-glucosamine 2-epimerase